MIFKFIITAIYFFFCYQFLSYSCLMLLSIFTYALFLFRLNRGFLDNWQFSTFLVDRSVQIHNNSHRDVYEGQRPFRFHSVRERCRIGGQIFAVSSLPEACTVGSGLIKAARVSGKS